MFECIKFFLTKRSNGLVSKVESFPLGINSKNRLLNIKNPPLIQLVLVVDFSLNSLTLFPLIFNSPNLTGGFTADTVAIGFLFCESILIFLNLY